MNAQARHPQRFRVEAPAAPLSAADRVVAAYQLVLDAQEALRRNGEEGSGEKIIAYVALNSLALRIGRPAAMAWAINLARMTGPDLTEPLSGQDLHG